MKASRIVLIAVGAIVAVSLIPRRVVVAPEWKITVTDEAGKPMPGIKLQQSSQDYSLERQARIDIKTTDASGTVVFPVRLRYAGRLLRFVGCADQVRRYAYHSSCGPHTWVLITYPAGYGQNDQREYAQAEMDFAGGEDKREDVVVVHKCRNGGTGITCAMPR